MSRNDGRGENGILSAVNAADQIIISVVEREVRWRVNKLSEFLVTWMPRRNEARASTTCLRGDSREPDLSQVEQLEPGILRSFAESHGVTVGVHQDGQEAGSFVCIQATFRSPEIISPRAFNTRRDGVILEHAPIVFAPTGKQRKIQLILPADFARDIRFQPAGRANQKFEIRMLRVGGLR